MATMSLVTQMQKMQDMKRDLGDFCTNLNRLMNEIGSQLDGYVRQGFPVEIAQKYKAVFYNPQKNDIDNLIAEVQSKHFEYIDDTIAELNAAANI